MENIRYYRRKISRVEKRQYHAPVSDSFHYRTERFHACCRSSFCYDSYCYFHVQKWDSNEKEHDEIWEEENSSARLVKQIRKAPDVSKSDAIADAGEQEVAACFPSFPVCHYFLMLRVTVGFYKNQEIITGFIFQWVEALIKLEREKSRERALGDCSLTVIEKNRLFNCDEEHVPLIQAGKLISARNKWRLRRVLLPPS